VATVGTAESAPLLTRAATRARPNGLTIEVGVHPRFGFRLVRLHGELDGGTTSDLALVLSTVLGDGFVAAAIDLSTLEFMDLNGARLIGTASTLFRRRGGEVVLLSPRAAVGRMLRMIGLEHLIRDAGEYSSVLSGFAVAESVSLTTRISEPYDSPAAGARARAAQRTSLFVNAKRANAARLF
jgi:anti-sigma B factor antagonist